MVPTNAIGLKTAQRETRWVTWPKANAARHPPDGQGFTVGLHKDGSFQAVLTFPRPDPTVAPAQAAA